MSALETHVNFAFRHFCFADSFDSWVLYLAEQIAKIRQKNAFLSKMPLPLYVLLLLSYRQLRRVCVFSCVWGTVSSPRRHVTAWTVPRTVYGVVCKYNSDSYINIFSFALGASGYYTSGVGIFGRSVCTSVSPSLLLLLWLVELVSRLSPTGTPLVADRAARGQMEKKSRDGEGK